VAGEVPVCVPSERGELVLKKGEQWGHELILRLPCVPSGHAVVILPGWVDEDGRFIGRLSCSECRKIYDQVRLAGWSP